MLKALMWMGGVIRINLALVFQARSLLERVIGVHKALMWMSGVICMTLPLQYMTDPGHYLFDACGGGKHVYHHRG